MSLPRLSPQLSLFGVENLLGAAFDADDRFRLFAEIIYPRLVAARSALEGCYCMNNGRPGIEPVLMLGVSILQFMERVPDGQAMEMVRYHLGWKLALQLDVVEVKAPHPTNLTHFRQRLLDHEQSKLAFDTILAGLREAGLVSPRARQRLDSTHVLGAVAAMSSAECVRETLRLALKELEGMGGVERPAFWERLWERYVQSKLDYRLEEAALTQKYLEAGRDMAELSAWLDGQSEAVRGGRHTALVKRVLGEHFEVVEGVLGKRKVRPAGSIQNPNDAEAQWSTKGKTGAKGWSGYKSQVAETVVDGPREKGEPTASFLTAVEAQVATGGEPAGMEQVLESEKASGQEAPPELHVDAGYVSAESIKEAAEAGRELVGPALGSSHQTEGFRTENFEVEVEQRRAVCPAGHVNTTCTRAERQEGEAATYRFGWGETCASCPLKASCLKHQKGQRQESRTLSVGEHHAYLQQRRREQKTEAFERRMNQRKAIEGTISELVRGYGLRRSRYRGLAKTALQHYLIGAACNAGRWIRRTAWRLRKAGRTMAEAIKAALRPAAAATAIGT